MKYLFLILFLLSLNLVKAEVKFVASEDILLASDLIVQAKIRSANQQYFRVEIIAVYHDGGRYGLQPGQYLKVKNYQWYGCMSPFNVMELDTVGLALSKLPNEWKVTNTQFFQEFNKGKAELVLQCSNSKYTSQEWQTEINALFTYFSSHNGKRCITTDLLSAQAESKSKWVNYLLAKFYGSLKLPDSFDCGSTIYDSFEIDNRSLQVKADAEQPNAGEEVLPFCAIAPKPLPSFSDSVKKIGVQVYTTYQKMLDEFGIDGRVYVRVTVNRDSTLSDAEIVRTVFPAADSLICAEVERSLQVEPGAKSKYEPKRCKFHIPIRIEREP